MDSGGWLEYVLENALTSRTADTYIIMFIFDINLVDGCEIVSLVTLF